MPRDLKPINPTPLTEAEQYQLNRLLDRRAESLPEAQARREKERARERRLQEKRDKMAAEEARLSKRLAELRVDLDVVSAEIFQLASSGVAFRSVNEQLQKLATLVPTQSFFNTRYDTFDRSQIKLLGEIALSMYEAEARPKGGGRPLRERMKSVKAEVGLDAGAAAPPDDRAALAAAIVQAGRRRRGEV